MAPLRRASLAPAGRTPVLRQRAKHRQKVSVVAALCRSPDARHLRLAHEVLVDLYVDDFAYAQFLRGLLRQRLRGPVVLLHDGAPLHRGDWTQDAIDDFSGRLTADEFPPYAPELNPVEQLWNWAKDKELANFVPHDVVELALATDHVMRDAASDQRRLRSFWEASKLEW